MSAPARTPLVEAFCYSKTHGLWKIIEVSTNKAVGSFYQFDGEFAEVTAKAVARAVNNAHWELEDEKEKSRLEKERDRLLEAKGKRQAEEDRIEQEVLKRLKEREEESLRAQSGPAPPQNEPDHAPPAAVA